MWFHRRVNIEDETTLRHRGTFARIDRLLLPWPWPEIRIERSFWPVFYLYMSPCQPPSLRASPTSLVHLISSFIWLVDKFLHGMKVSVHFNSNHLPATVVTHNITCRSKGYFKGFLNLESHIRSISCQRSIHGMQSTLPFQMVIYSNKLLIGDR